MVRQTGRIMAQLSEIEGALRSVLSRVETAVQGRSKDLPKIQPRLVAVSKIKPVEAILEAYKHGQRHFGENYVQELVQKANDPKLLNCEGIQWHFIGHLQRNKCNNVTGCPNLSLVETVDSSKLATALNNSWAKKNTAEQLKIFIQVNTSGEENKSGCLPNECSAVVGHVLNECPSLKFSGLMTIGEYGYDYSQGPNPDFTRLVACRDVLCSDLNLSPSEVELSMGMSSDYEQAIAMGSTNIRVGSTIFGAR